MPIKCDKKESFCYIFRYYFLKDGKLDNRQVGQSVMKPVDANSSKKRRYIQERGDKTINGFHMEILKEGALEKALNVEKKTPDEKPKEINI